MDTKLRRYNSIESINVTNVKYEIGLQFEALPYKNRTQVRVCQSYIISYSTFELSGIGILTYRNAPKSVSLMTISSRVVQNRASVSKVSIVLLIEYEILAVKRFYFKQQNNDILK